MVLSMDRWCGKVALVTGASSGCGAAIAKALVSHGMKVVGLARRKEKIDELAQKLTNCKGKLYGVKADVTVESDILAAFDWTAKNVGPVAVVVNNAGLSQPNSLVNGDTKMWATVFNTNVMALNIATREGIKQMQQNNIDGHVVHINSTLGHYVAMVPGLNVYPASKFAVTALVETLRQELMAMKSKIRVTGISPGPIDSGFATTSNLSTNEHFDELWKAMPKLRPEDVADAVVYALSTPPHVQIQDVMIRPVGEPV